MADPKTVIDWSCLNCSRSIEGLSVQEMLRIDQAHTCQPTPETQTELTPVGAQGGVVRG